MKNSTKAYLAITLQSLIIGFSFFVVKVALNSTDTIGLLAHRFTVTAISVLLYKFFKPSSISVSFSDWKKVAPFSLAYPVVFFLFQTLGLTMISSSEAGIVYAISPILTFIVARIVLKERANRPQTVFMILSVLGVIFINTMKGFNIGNYSYLGFLFILMSVVSFSIYNVFIKKLSKSYSAMTIVYVVSICGCVIFNLVSVIQHLVTGSLETYFKPFTNISFVLSILYLGVIASFISSILSTYALGKLEATTVGLFNNVSTVVSILVGIVCLHEQLYYYHYIGIIAILVGTIGFNLLKSPPYHDGGI